MASYHVLKVSLPLEQVVNISTFSTLTREQNYTIENCFEWAKSPTMHSFRHNEWNSPSVNSAVHVLVSAIQLSFCNAAPILPFVDYLLFTQTQVLWL